MNTPPGVRSGVRSLVSVFCILAAAGTVHAQPTANRIDISRVRDLSWGEIEVTIAYSYDGALGSGVYLDAVPLDDRGVEMRENINSAGRETARTGDNTAALVIRAVTEFVSVEVSACMFRPEATRPIVCDSLQHTKKWSPPATVAPAEIVSFTVSPAQIRAGEAATLRWNVSGDPGEMYIAGAEDREGLSGLLGRKIEGATGEIQVTPENTKTYTLLISNGPKKQAVTVEVSPTSCTIKGRVSGQLRYETRDDRNQRVSWTLEQMIMVGPDGTRRAPLVNGTYAFENVSADATYRLFAANFQSQPRERQVSCARQNESHDFAITGPPRN